MKVIDDIDWKCGNLHGFRRALLSLLILGSLVLSMQLTFAKILDPEGQGPSHELLISLAAPLEQLAGANTIIGRASDVEPDDRPRVAALSGFKPGAKDLEIFERGAWELAFERNAIGVLVAVKKSTKPSNVEKTDKACKEATPPLETKGCAFVATWLASDPASRIFLAFTRADLQAAEKVRVALESQGYTVFVYLNGNESTPWADPEMVGEIFAQSKHRLVLDTPQARANSGVAFEAYCCEWHFLPPRKPSSYAKWLKGA